jgi:hypothetical protein
MDNVVDCVAGFDPEELNESSCHPTLSCGGVTAIARVTVMTASFRSKRSMCR